MALMPLDATLNDYSRRFAERLFARFPEWRDHASVDEQHASTLRVTVTSPGGAELMVRTYGDQVTLDFGPHWHEHLGPWTSSDESKVFDTAIARLDDIVHDRVVVVSRFVFGRHAWSRAMPAQQAHRAHLGRRAVTSWSGAKQPPLTGI
jgi:hypothetical protein